MVFLKLMVFSVAILLASSQKTKSISEIANVVDEAKEDIKKLVKEIEALKETFAEELK